MKFFTKNKKRASDEIIVIVISNFPDVVLCNAIVDGTAITVYLHYYANGLDWIDKYILLSHVAWIHDVAVMTLTSAVVELLMLTQYAEKCISSNFPVPMKSRQLPKTGFKILIRKIVFQKKSSS